jgi:hypothetical protein
MLTRSEISEGSISKMIELLTIHTYIENEVVQR